LTNGSINEFLMLLQLAPAAGAAVTAAGRNALITSLLVCFGFIVCTTPCQIVLLVNYANQSVDNSHWFYQFTVVLFDASSCINAFIYAAKYREFQQGVRRLITELSTRLTQQQAEVVMQVESVDTGTGNRQVQSTDV